MEQPAPQQSQQPPKQDPSKRSLSSLIKKYFWYIVVFFIIAITSGVVMADHEAKSTANWKTYTSKDAGISFKHPTSYKIIEDKGWRITVYTSEQNTENNYKILYSHKDPTVSDSAEEQFLANCQATKVSEIDANSTRIKVYEDSSCGGQLVENSVIVYSENGMNYDIGLFGTTDQTKLYQFLTTFMFETSLQVASPTPISSIIPSKKSEISPSVSSASAKCGGPDAIQCTAGYFCEYSGDSLNAYGICVQNKNSANQIACDSDAKKCSDGSFVGRTGPYCEFVCPK